jgi:uracil-DNA glycosylase
MFILLLAQKPLRALRLGESIFVFFPQRRQERQGIRALVCYHPKKTLRTLRLGESMLFFSLAEARRAQ